MVSKGIKISLSLALMVFVFTMTSASTFIQPAQAATLGDVRIVPMTNLASVQTTYDIFFTATTTGKIKTIEIDFGSNFDIASATRLVENSGIGAGSLSIQDAVLTYTVKSPTNIRAGTNIRLEIASIIANSAGDFQVDVTTKGTTSNIIDGPTTSSSFPIQGLQASEIEDGTITGDDISPGFMIKKTLKDDDTGHFYGWNPEDVASTFLIDDSQVSESSIVIAQVRGSANENCGAQNVDDGTFTVNCQIGNSIGPIEGSILDYTIINLPTNVVTSSLSTSTSENTSPYESLRAHDQIASEFP